MVKFVERYIPYAFQKVSMKRPRRCILVTTIWLNVDYMQQLVLCTLCKIRDHFERGLKHCVFGKFLNMDGVWHQLKHLVELNWLPQLTPICNWCKVINDQDHAVAVVGGIHELPGYNFVKYQPYWLRFKHLISNRCNFQCCKKLYSFCREAAI